MPRGRPKNPENFTPREEIAFFLQWAEEYGYADIPAVTALRTDHPTAQHIHDAIQWAEQQEFHRIAAALRGTRPSTMIFAADAAELRRQEIARLSDALTPRIEALRSMTTQGFRSVIALMLERFGHTVISNPEAPELVTSKLEKKFVTACARPADLAPTGTRDLARLHDAVIGANAQRGFFISALSFTDQAEKYAESAPTDLFNGARLIKALNQSRNHVLLPQTDKAMCQECGEIVEHRIDGEQDEARPCGNGHLVAPTIARAMLLPPRPAATGSGDNKTKPAPRPLSRREIRAHNYKCEARMMRKPRGG